MQFMYMECALYGMPCGLQWYNYSVVFYYKWDPIECTLSMYLYCILLWPDDGGFTAETCRLEVNYKVL